MPKIRLLKVKIENNNGIRDDVEAELKKEYTGKTLEMALRHARVMQKFILLDHEDELAIWTVSTEMGSRIKCLRLADRRWSDIVDEIRFYTMNSALRLKAYEKSNESASGKAYSLEENPDCDAD